MLVDGDETVRPVKVKSHKPMPSWEGTLKILGKGPARYAPLPPGAQVDRKSASEVRHTQTVVERKGEWHVRTFQAYL